MGIKFHCPNGHKLNVKAFLAGKRGVCPKCGTKFRIPAASEPSLNGEEVEDADDAHAAAAHGNGSGVVAETASAARVIAPAVTSAPAATTSPAGPGGTTPDPIAEQPAAVWYVRPPSGGQYGPARGEVMRQWLAEGRISSDSLVWRDGWTDWQNAGQLFPQLTAPAGPPGDLAAEPAATRPGSLAPRSSIRTAARYQAKQQNSSTLAISVLVGLAIVCVLLVGVLVYVVMNLK